MRPVVLALSVVAACGRTPLDEDVAPLLDVVRADAGATPPPDAGPKPLPEPIRCGDDVPGLVTLATTSAPTPEIAIADGAVFFLDPSARKLRRVSRCGGDVVDVAPIDPAASSLVAGGGRLVWLEPDRVASVATDGTGLGVEASAGAALVATSDDGRAWVASESGGTFRVARLGGDAACTFDAVEGLAVGPAGAYVATDGDVTICGEDGTVHAGPSGSAPIDCLRVDANEVVASVETTSGGAIVHAADAAPFAMLVDTVAPTCVAIDTDFAYWLDPPPTRSVRRVPRAGGASSVVVHAPGAAALSLAVDTGYVFGASRDKDEIWRAPKNPLRVKLHR